MGFFDKIFGKKQQQETVDHGLQKTREGFLGKSPELLPEKARLMKKYWTG